MDDELLYQIGLSMAKGITGANALEIIRRVGSPKNFFSLSRQELIAMTNVNSPMFDDGYRRGLLEEARQQAQFVANNNIRCLFIGSPGYPARLANYDDAPVLLFALGDFDLNCKHTVGIVGTRHATTYGINFTKKLVQELAEMIPGVGIISGLAFGIDVTAHKAALEAKTPTMAVLAHGLQMIYPSEHRSVAVKMLSEGGGLVSEFPHGAKPYRNNFLKRNRIVAALSDALVVVESDFRGGSMSTARMATLYNRDVFALPGRATDMYSRGTNHLIANHTAQLLTCAKDLVEHMQWQPVEKAPESPTLFPVLSPDLKQILDFIGQNPEATANEMCVSLGISYATLSDRLFKLEMEDFITSQPGGRFVLNHH